jgi:chemotaxis protein methyltransferase CheR
MSSVVSPAQLDRFRRAITRRLALHFDVMPPGDLVGTLNRRVRSRGVTVDAYLAWLESASSDGDVAALARELTVGETSFFRNIEQFHALREVVVPALLRRGGRSRPVRILSAGCASGEEAYSIEMTLRAMDEKAPTAWDILAVDVNPAAIEKARRGVYTSWALRDTPPDMQGRWFRADGGTLEIDGRIRDAVRFEQRNLAVEAGDPWRPGAYDIVFCRNVLMYFTRTAAEAVVARIERSLAHDGILFLGHAETLRGLSQGFALREANGAFYYQREAYSGATESARAGSSTPPPRQVPAGAVGTAAARPAAARDPLRCQDPVAAATSAPTSVPTSTSMPTFAATSARTEGAPALAGAIALFRKERFDEAQAALQALDDETVRTPDALLLHALLLAHRGSFAPAEQTCRRLLALDESHAGAYYLMAMCRDGLGDCAGAARRDRCAIELDPAFSMPRLHLGLLSRRAGDCEAAKRHLDKSISLLAHEDAARLELYGGGFGREALLAICRAELRQCEHALSRWDP